jgi:hypothetical protein
MIGRISRLGAPALLALSTVPAAAQAPAEMVSAAQPAGLLMALMNAGYDAKLTRDTTGDPLINVTTAGYPISLIFFGCSEQTHDGCDSLQLATGLDRTRPWNPKAALRIMSEQRFIAVQLDEEGDPFFTWDIVTGRSGIPAPVFLDSMRRFENAVALAAETVFAK